MRPLIAGNWKMHGTTESLSVISAIAEGASAAKPADVLVCPPFTLIARAAQIASGRIAIGGQDCHMKMSGAYTGDISAAMLRDVGAGAAIVGHSERRRYHGESNSIVAAKAEAGLQAGLLTLICIGESEEEKDSGRTDEVICSQIAGSVPDAARAATSVIAYEPVWAIGSGRTPTEAAIARVHGLIRNTLSARFGIDGSEFRILYGGSVNPSNAGDILALPNVNGALVGGASLKADEFLRIVRSIPRT